MYPFSSIKDYHLALQNRQTNCLSAVNFYLQQIHQNKHLNAFVEVFDDAIERANFLDQLQQNGKPLGKLHGVVVSIKDVICYKDHKVSAASKMLNNFTSLYNATAVERLQQEGAIIIGRNNCDEFAMGSSSENSFYGVTKNGFDESLVPGGSSGGSAVAVQMNMSMVSLGSDTGGSVRQPADFCGIVGFKPTYGKISRYGLIAYASSFDQIGIFAKNIHDVSLVLEVIAGADDFDSTAANQEIPAYSKALSSTQKYKIAYFKQALEHQSLDQEIASAIKSFIKKLQADGHTIDAIDFELLDQTIPTYYVLTTAEASSNLSRYDGVKFGYRASGEFGSLQEMYKKTRSEGFGKEVHRRIMLGTFVLSEGYFDAYYTKAQQVRQMLSQSVQEIFSNYQFIISPTVPSTAFKIGEKKNDATEMYLADLYTVLANLVGVPAISIPLFKHSNQMPFGLQMMATHHHEIDLLSFSNYLLDNDI